MTSKSRQAPIPPWGLAVAGATGAVLANALVYPLDIVKTRLQVQVKRKPSSDKPTGSSDEDQHYDSTLHAITSILKDEGPAGLYSGMTGSLIGVASQNFAYFYWYTVVRILYLSRTSSDRSPSTAAELSLGAVAGALAQIFTIPIAVVTTRQQTQPKRERKGILATARDVVESEDGWTGLWRGMKASLVLVVNPSITYGAYQRLSRILYPGRTTLRAHEAFLLGAMSKSLATLVTQPLIVSKVNLQSRRSAPPSPSGGPTSSVTTDPTSTFINSSSTAGSNQPERVGKPFKSFGHVLSHILHTEGPSGLFKGLGPQLLKGLLVQGFLMMTKQRVETIFVILFAYWRRRAHKAEELVEKVAGKVVTRVVDL